MPGGKNKTARKPKQRLKGHEPSLFLLGAAIVTMIVFGFIVKLLLFPTLDNRSTTRTNETSARADEPLEGLVQLVASEFRCACGGCGELPLIDCDCDMPRGAIEEKNYIRERISEGLPPQKVIEMVDELYGHRDKG